MENSVLFIIGLLGLIAMSFLQKRQEVQTALRGLICLNYSTRSLGGGYSNSDRISINTSRSANSDKPPVVVKKDEDISDEEAESLRQEKITLDARLKEISKKLLSKEKRDLEKRLKEIDTELKQ